MGRNFIANEEISLKEISVAFNASGYKSLIVNTFYANVISYNKILPAIEFCAVMPLTAIK